MSNKLAFISQSGNVMKSTLALATALEAQKNGLSVAIADLDREHRTAAQWGEQRQQSGIEPLVTVKPVDTAKAALNAYEDEDLFIVDCTSRATEATLYVAQNVDLVVLPTPPSKKDIDLSLLTFYELVNHGVPVERLVLVFSRVGSRAELAKAQSYVGEAEINGKHFLTLESAVWEKVAYRAAINDGYAITETSYPSLNESARAVIFQLITILNR